MRNKCVYTISRESNIYSTNVITSRQQVRGREYEVHIDINYRRRDNIPDVHASGAFPGTDLWSKGRGSGEQA